MKEKRRRDRLMEVAAANPESWGQLGYGFYGRVLVESAGTAHRHCPPALPTGTAHRHCPPALPTLSSWAEEGKPLRLVQKSVAKDDPEPKAISCYGLYVPQLDKETWLRFVDGRPVSPITTRFLRWSLKKLEEKLEEIGKKVLLLIWDNASWHVSKEVRRWLGSHNREVKRAHKG